MSTRKRTPATNPPQTNLEELLKDLAQHIDDRKTFLALAKQAWHEAHYDAVPTRGNPSVADKCFLAIADGFHELDMDSDYCPRSYEMRMAGEDDLSIPSNHQRLPLGRVVKMIRDRVPGVTVSTARKYARIWERETELGPLNTEARMTQYRRTKKTRPSLYRAARPKPRR